MSLTDRYVLAIDLGTTTLAACLIDRETGGQLTAVATLNPQRQEGFDVVSRLAVAGIPEGLERLRVQVSGAIVGLSRELCAKAGLSLADISQAVVAGNTVMQHLLCGTPVDALSHPPFRPRDTSSRSVASTFFGWQQEFPVHIFPQPGGFVGGDLVAFLFGQAVSGSMSPASCPRLFLDLGTNAEIALQTKDRLLTTSAAAGPAFEGGNLSCGMIAEPGAVTGVTLAGNRPHLQVFGDIPPIGICGSGAISAIAALLRTKVVTPMGQLLPPEDIPSNLANYVVGAGKDATFVLHRDARKVVALTQQDIRQIQLASAAVRAGIDVLMARGGEQPNDLVEVIITGSFGAALALADLEAIGLLSPGLAAKCRFITNGVLAGLSRAVMDSSGLIAVDHLAASIQVIPLSGTPLFEESFISHMNFPE